MVRTKPGLTTLFFLITFGMLVATLWPFNPFPCNRVSWLEQTNGLRFNKRGVVLSQQPFALANSGSSSDPCSLELWLKPAQTNSVSTILDFYDSEDPRRFQLRPPAPAACSLLVPPSSVSQPTAVM